MRGDFSRDTFDPVKHFSRVLQQQGRVHVDADWNEQSAIVMHYLHTLAADLIGPFAGPSGEGFGFEIHDVTKDGFSIGRGRYYVDGILCENERETARYEAQTDFPFPPELETGTGYLVYLDVWERHVTALEDDDIREKALGGADTTTRSKVIWQVKLGGLEDLQVSQPTAVGVRKNWKAIVDRLQPPHAGCLRARVDPPKNATDPCLTAPDARYRGAENQLYRVEIHKGGPAGEATFKWSKNNGAVATRVTLAGTELTAESARGFVAGQWVELTSDAQELRGVSGRLVKLLKVDGERLSLESPVPVPGDVVEGEDWPTKARGWDQRKNSAITLEDGAVPVTESAEATGWIPIEDGIQVQFLPSSDATNENLYRAGDYWLIPARVASGGIEWPVKENDSSDPLPSPPRGVRHHFAPLATLTVAGGDWTVNDCRSEFAPIKNNFTAVINSFGEAGMNAPAPCEPPEEPVDG
jgi:Family of unknown function (DUF6519)